MLRWCLGTFVACVLLAARPTAQSLAQNYDVSKFITLKGTVAAIAIEPGVPHVYLIVDTQDANGKIEQWVIEGDSWASLNERGWRFGPRGPVRLGDSVAVVAYLPKAGANVLEAVPASLTAVLELAKGGRLAHGIDVTLSDGKKLVFGRSQ